MTLKTMGRIEKVLKDVNATLWIQHDMDTFLGLEHSPEYYQ